MRTINIDTRAEQTVFRGWGTSLAWWANAVGRWPRHRRVAVVRQLFSLAEGGLGLTVVRFNAGGGENPGVEVTMTPRAVMEGYRSAPGAELDRHADPGQRAVLRDAVRLAEEAGGTLHVEVFGNSPPWWATVSGSVTGAAREGNLPAPNLSRTRTREYLLYLRDVADLVEDDAGVRVESISPFNEPTSRWWILGGRQEGCAFDHEGIDDLLTEYVRSPELAGGRIVSASEEWSLEQAVATWDALGPSARRAIGRINVHTYSGDSRAALRTRAAAAGMPLWVSEFGEGGHHGWELATAIVRDLRELAPEAWVLWQALSPDNWGLLRLSSDGSHAEKTDKHEVFAQFTRSIRPGMRLVGTDDMMSIAATGDGRFSAVVLGDPEVAEWVRLDSGGTSLGAARVRVVSAIGGGVSAEQTLDCSDGVLEFAVPAGAVAAVTADVAGRIDTRR